MLMTVVVLEVPAASLDAAPLPVLTHVPLTLTPVNQAVTNLEFHAIHRSERIPKWGRFFSF